MSEDGGGASYDSSSLLHHHQSMANKRHPREDWSMTRKSPLLFLSLLVSTPTNSDDGVSRSRSAIGRTHRSCDDEIGIGRLIIDVAATACGDGRPSTKDA